MLPLFLRAPLVLLLLVWAVWGLVDERPAVFEEVGYVALVIVCGNIVISHFRERSADPSR